MAKTDITPTTKVSELISTYPELKQELIDISSAFKKLNNPVLLRTIGRVTSLKQAAKIGGVSLLDMINRLRLKVGLPEIKLDDEPIDSYDKAPDWFVESKITERINANSFLDQDKQPIDEVLNILKRVSNEDIVEVVSEFPPEPLIDMVKKKKYRVFCIKKSESEFCTYISANS